ncbi:RNA recognition motif domain - like 10 [Theobroma cacao]|nr:RNA recognition motif domain - like 10 [Theobroma cacao]
MAFVDNVSLQISWSKVRNVFKDYRRVVDLFIARRRNDSVRKRSTFAFVRYCSEEELRRVVNMVTKSESKGWLLDWKARKRAHGSLIAAQRESNWIANGGRDLRSYKEVVELSGNRRYDTHRLQVETRCEDDDSESDQTDGEKETEFLLSILEGNAEWLNKSMVGTMKPQITQSKVQEELVNRGITARVQIMDDRKLLITFEEAGEINWLVNRYPVIWGMWFDGIKPFGRIDKEN